MMRNSLITIPYFSDGNSALERYIAQMVMNQRLNKTDTFYPGRARGILATVLDVVRSQYVSSEHYSYNADKID